MVVKTAKIVNKYKPAPFWKRFFAYIIDIILVNLIISLPFRDYFSKFSSNLEILFGATDKNLFLITFIVVMAVIFYFSVLEYKTNQTVGKMLMNIYVVSATGNKITFTQAFLRNLIKPFSIVLLVDVAYMFFKRTNQRLFDIFSQTAVVEKEVSIR